jgi:hypothetical protein
LRRSSRPARTGGSSPSSSSKQQLACSWGCVAWGRRVHRGQLDAGSCAAGVDPPAARTRSREQLVPQPPRSPQQQRRTRAGPAAIIRPPLSACKPTLMLFLDRIRTCCVCSRCGFSWAPLARSGPEAHLPGPVGWGRGRARQRTLPAPHGPHSGADPPAQPHAVP